MRAILSVVFFALSIGGQFYQTWLLYCVITGLYMDTKLAVLLFPIAFIATYWLNLIFDELVTTKKETFVGGRSGMVVRSKNTIFPIKVKRTLRKITNVWTIVVLLLWGFYFVKYSLWNLF